MLGKATDQNIAPNYIYEHIIAKHYKWSLEDIRNMDYRDFIIHLRLCMESENMDKEWDMKLQGVDVNKKRVRPEDVLNPKK